MNALLLVLGVGAALLIAYFTYGRWVSRRVFGLREDAPTPAVLHEDGRDYCPTKRGIVFGHHFTSIAGTGPIVGPAIAVIWGWVPAVLWVLFGSIFIGAVHDLGALVVSLRNKGRSIGDIAGDILGPRVRLIFLGVLIMGLWIVLAIFGLVIASVMRLYPGSIFPILLQIPLAVIIGIVVHRQGRSILIPSVVALVVMYLSVIFGNVWPLSVFNEVAAGLPLILWVGGLLVYAYIASVLPVWVLLQPRDYINSLQLISCLGLLVAGLIVAALFGGYGQTVAPESMERLPLEIVAPALNMNPEGAPPMFPILFITIACGAISGFHCLVASGTTSKQVSCERDAQVVGYGSMLTEGFLATLVIAACVAGLGLGLVKAPDRIGGAAYYISLPGGEVELADHVSEDEQAIWVQDNPGWALVLFRPGQRIELTRGIVQMRPRMALPLDDPDSAFNRANTANVHVPSGVQLTGNLAYSKQYESWSAAGSLGSMVGAFVTGAANFIRSLGIPIEIALALMGVFVASFAATTMDTACRLQRYVIQELSRTFLPPAAGRNCAGCGYDLSGLEVGMACPECGSGAPPVDGSLALKSQRAKASSLNPFKWLSTTHGATLFAVVTAAGLASIPAPGQTFSIESAGQGGLILWPLFGATNQILAGLAFLVISAWLIATKRPRWFIVIPTALMIVLPAWALIWQAFVGDVQNPSWLASGRWLLVGTALVTLALEAWLVVEVVARLNRGVDPGDGGARFDGFPDGEECPAC